MASNSEATIGSNITSLGKLITKYTDMGVAYNPSRDDLKLPALILLKTTAADAHKAYGEAELAYGLIAAERKNAFAPLDRLITRCLNGFQNSDALDEIKDRAKAKADKIRGIDTSAPPPPPAPGEEPADDYSTAQQSYGMIAENFGLFIEILASEPTYLPNNDDIKVPALEALLATMLVKNTAVEAPYVTWKNALKLRDKIFFEEKNGLVDRGQASKKYILSEFGTGSPEHDAVKGVRFRRKSE